MERLQEEREAAPMPFLISDPTTEDPQMLRVHKALPNLSRDRLRLSVDFRYQPLSHPVAPSSRKPHYDRQTWEEIYADWTSTRYQYYWRDLPIRSAGDDPRVVAARQAAFGSPQAPTVEQKTQENTKETSE